MPECLSDFAFVNRNSLNYSITNKFLVAQEILFWYFHDEVFGFVSNDALAAQARVDARIHGAVNEVFLLIRNLGKRIATAEHVHVARGAAAYAATVMLQGNVVVESDVEHRLTRGGNMGLGGLSVGEAKRNGNSVHSEGRMARIGSEGRGTYRPSGDRSPRPQR